MGKGLGVTEKQWNSHFSPDFKLAVPPTASNP